MVRPTPALLGAAALGDIGSHFPPSDDRWKGADSIDLLERSVAVLAAKGYRVVNVDITVICQTPKIGPRASEMRAKLADLVALERRCCSSVDWDLRELPDAGRLRLEVRGLDPGSALLGSLVGRTGSAA